MAFLREIPISNIHNSRVTYRHNKRWIIFCEIVKQNSQVLHFLLSCTKNSLLWMNIVSYWNAYKSNHAHIQQRKAHWSFFHISFPLQDLLKWKINQRQIVKMVFRNWNIYQICHCLNHSYILSCILSTIKNNNN